MKKACSLCGGIHDRYESCPKSPHKKEDYVIKDEIYKFRNSAAWQKKREQIKKRDLYLCQACLNNLPGTVRQINREDLSVHHIQPLRTNFDKRLEENNLITLCEIHHSMADRGLLSAKTLKNLLKNC